MDVASQLERLRALRDADALSEGQYQAAVNLVENCLKAFIDDGVAALLRRWPEMFKPSERCRPPHLHRDTLRNKLFQAHATHAATSADDLVAMVTRVNEALKARPASAWPDRLRGKPLQKAKAHGCFLGLAEYSWLNMLGA